MLALLPLKALAQTKQVLKAEQWMIGEMTSPRRGNRPDESVWLFLTALLSVLRVEAPMFASCLALSNSSSR